MANLPIKASNTPAKTPANTPANTPASNTPASNTPANTPASNTPAKTPAEFQAQLKAEFQRIYDSKPTSGLKAAFTKRLQANGVSSSLMPSAAKKSTGWADDSLILALLAQMKG